ncbi:MAG: hypothetical protein H7296_11850 [Bacteroidia bacterium]|nr:hypothetical protein [Bacteroidia bacterium]
MKNILCYLVCLIFSGSTLLSAQTQDRVEYKVDEARNLYNIFPIADQGLIIGFIPVAVVNEITEYRCIKLGTDFKEQKSVGVPIPAKYNLITNFTEGHFIYLMFAVNANKFKQYTLIRLNTTDMNFAQYNGKFKSKFNFKELQATNGVVYLGGTMNRKPFIGAIDMHSEPISITEFIMDNTKKGTKAINAISIDNATQSCDLLLKAKNKKESIYLFKEISNYKFCKEVSIKFPDYKEPNSAKIHFVDSTKKLIAGTYGSSEAHSALNPSTSAQNEVEGVYFGSVINNKQNFLQLIPFASFQNFKMVSESGATNLNVNFHNFFIRGDETWLFGEVYYPFLIDNNIFAGYRWKGAVVMVLDKTGNLKWENGLDIINGTLSNNTNFKFRFITLPDSGIKIVYSDNNIIRSKIIYSSKESKNLVDIKVGIDNIDNLAPTTHVDVNGVEYWYSDNYLVYAVQKINKDASEKDKINKTLFYFNKIKLNE